MILCRPAYPTIPIGVVKGVHTKNGIAGEMAMAILQQLWPSL